MLAIGSRAPPLPRLCHPPHLPNLPLFLPPQSLPRVQSGCESCLRLALVLPSSPASATHRAWLPRHCYFLSSPLPMNAMLGLSAVMVALLSGAMTMSTGVLSGVP